MDSNTELNPDLPQETRDAIRAGLLESEALVLEARARVCDRLAQAQWAGPTLAADACQDARVFRDEARSKREKAARLRSKQAGPACGVCGDCSPVAAYGGWCCEKALRAGGAE